MSGTIKDLTTNNRGPEMKLLEILGGQWVSVLAQVGGALTFLGLCWAWLRKPLKKLWQLWTHVYNIRETQESILSGLDEIRGQMKPNGGASIVDSLNRIEQKQEFTTSFLKTQLNAHHKALFECDQEGKCVWVNRPYTILTGRSFEQVRGTGWLNAAIPEQRDAATAKWHLAIEEQREYDEDLLFRRADGDVIPVHVNAYVIRHEQSGQVLGYLGEVTLVAQDAEEIPISTKGVK